MGKPSAPKPPDYAAAAQQQGEANVNSAIASNYLNQANQVGPYGSLSYSYKPGLTLPDGTNIPQATVTTTLSPAQQKLLDQNNAIASALNATAQKGIGYVDKITGQPLDLSKLPTMATSAPSAYTPPSLSDFNSARDQVTNAYMSRLQPSIDRDREALDAKLATQGITQGSQAYGADYDTFNRGVNDQRTAALLAGDTAAQNLFQNAMQAGQLSFNQGLAGDQFQNQARNQALQEAEYLRTEPLNVLNALRSGNQVTLPQFGNVSGGAGIQAAPIYQAASDQYGAAQQAYANQMANYSSILNGLGSIGGAAILRSDRRLKTNIKFIGMKNGFKWYSYNYIWGGPKHIGVMADEVPSYALGPVINGFATVNYGALRRG